jgi:hypothetical protein
MPKVERLTDQDGETECWHFECPGCGIGHAPYTKNRPGAPTWTFNGDIEKPTFSPSLLVRWQFSNGKPTKVCHSFIRHGKIEFLSDCTHALAGQTIELPEIEA